MTNILFMCAAVIFFDARGEAMDTKRAVATVLKNELNGKGTIDFCRYAPWNRFKKSKDGIEVWIKEIQKEIYQIIREGYPDEVAWLECNELAGSLLRPEFQLLGNWTNYYNPRRDHKYPWMKKLVDVVDIGRLRFGRLP